MIIEDINMDAMDKAAKYELHLQKNKERKAKYYSNPENRAKHNEHVRIQAALKRIAAKEAERKITEPHFME